MIQLSEATKLELEATNSRLDTQPRLPASRWHFRICNLCKHRPCVNYTITKVPVFIEWLIFHRTISINKFPSNINQELITT